jgi:hypothetical protein
VEDIFTYAAKCVANKGVLARIGHSAKLHSMRSAVSSKGSAASKGAALVGIAVRATFSAVPVPVVGGLIGAVESKIERAIRSAVHTRSLNKAVTQTEMVKFTLKELSVEELDRYRWKVSDAITEFNKLIAQKETKLAGKRAEQATCDVFLDLAMAAEQVKRRIDILAKACLHIAAAIKITGEWIEDCMNGPGTPSFSLTGAAPVASGTGGISKGIAELKNWLAANVQAELDAYNRGASDEEKEKYMLENHAKCDRWCCFRNAGKPDNWTNAKDKAAFVLRNLADPFVPDSFNNNLGSLWKDDGK